MAKKHWLLLVAILAIVGIGVLLVLALVLSLFLGHKETAAGDAVRPVYITDQSASSHAGYRRTTLKCGDEVYVNDYEEACLQLANPVPTQTIGRIGSFSHDGVCAIPGQPTTAYIAGDCGSEMPAFEPFRNGKQPAFDWRTANFRQMDFLPPGGRSNWRNSTNTALIAEVVRLLREGTPVELPNFTFVSTATNTTVVRLTCDELPGLQFCPLLYSGSDGTIYLAESMMLDDTAPNPPQLHARWVPASPMLTEWLKGP